MKISDVLSLSLTNCALPGRSKKRVLENISKMLTEQLGGDSEQSEILLDHLVAREKLGSTGLGKGVAIPHCRTPGVKKIHGCLTKLVAPVDFDAVDDEPVDLIFALVVPEEKNDEHLSTLARIAAIMQDEQSRQLLRQCTSSQQLFDTALALERSNKL